MTEPAPPRPLSAGERAVSAFFGNALLAVGWISVVLGGLCTLAIGVFSIVGVGDHEGHMSLEDWSMPVMMLGFGGACVWAGRGLKRRAATRERDDDRPGA